MPSLIRATVLSVVVLFGSQAAVASEAAQSRPAPAQVGAGPTRELPPLVAQYSDNSSSSGSSRVRISRGVVKLGVFVVIALFGAAGWVVKRMTMG
jgi:hypothetical protein